VSDRLDAISGVAHAPAKTPVGVVVLAHGAGGSRDSPLLIAICEQWADRGWLAIRYNLPYRRRRATGPPSGSAAADRAGIVEAITLARSIIDATGSGRLVIAGGHSYGGRLTSMALADGHRPKSMAEADGQITADTLTLFSYPLHPPGKPDRLRTEHFGAIAVPTVFTHGTADPFGSIAELCAAAGIITAPTEIVEITGARHDLASKTLDVPALAVDAALRRGGLGDGRSGTVEI
jgi:predicted alpha/beta-hydrolase family hydrolase